MGANLDPSYVIRDRAMASVLVYWYNKFLPSLLVYLINRSEYLFKRVVVKQNFSKTKF